MSKRLVNWIAGLSLFGLVLSIYSLAHKTGFTSGAICNLSDTFSCDIVNQGPYSEIYGIPVAMIGVLGYALILAAALLKRVNSNDRTLSLFLILSALGGLGFALYLSGIEMFILRAWCIVCLLSQATIAAIAVLSSILFYREKKYEDFVPRRGA